VWHVRIVQTPLPGTALRRVRTAGLAASEIDAIRGLLWAAFPGDEGFTEDDWEHGLGGLHVLLETAADRRIVAHAAVIERELHVGGRPLRTGYVEAVATDPDRQAQGFGTTLMRDVGRWILEAYELGALGTGRHRFYERLGWRVWRGPTYVRLPDGDRRTPDEDGDILVLLTPRTPPIDLTDPISCDWRPGDVW
jgi:aminoglycoside 2'-N-acetyltransferase I